VMYEGLPLCRLGYRGTLDEWDFAIYRYSTESFGQMDFGPARCSAREAIGLALSAYGFR
jgi:hypothetical protein